jgi:4-hydroxy-3-methylbut-2-enyl diphosphate reductase
VDQLAAAGAVFVDSLEEIPDGSVAIFSAHGVSPEVREEAKRRKLQIIDATCPLVTKVHLEVVRYAREKNHDEVIGTFGEAPGCVQVVSNLEDVDALENVQRDRVVYTTQTTLSLDDTRAIVERLKQRFPSILAPVSSDICYATQNRQAALKAVAKHADVILVVGSQNSSNSNRLVEVAQNSGMAAYLIANDSEIHPEWLDGCFHVGLTAGASTPEILVQKVIKKLETYGFADIQEVEVIEEDVHFPLPAELEQLRMVSLSQKC